ncbi:MAG: hydrolase [Pseudochelatococcus sp.]|jgi:5'-deoxynucleotidase YfbR-like HD superfamily hydrolase|uniref:hydrolase n=1 Tax=Pseudochelatococcus sp. TaxID=2020869 RepID=UPI003D9398D0
MTPRPAKAPRVWQRMLSGRRLDLIDPSPLDVEIEDIAHGLARVARWNGQTLGAHIFSVAQHTLLVELFAEIADPALSREARLAVLLHDGAEYVVGDIISPFKAVLGDTYKDIEKRLLAAIHIRFGLPARPAPALERAIKKADRAAAFYEATRLAGFGLDEARGFFGKVVPLPAGGEAFLHPWDAETAKARYLARFSAALHAA